MTETGPNATECNRTVGCGCTGSVTFRLPVASFDRTSKDRQKPVYTGCNQSFIYLHNTYYLQALLIPDHTFTVTGAACNYSMMEIMEIFDKAPQPVIYIC